MTDYCITLRCAIGTYKEKDFLKTKTIKTGSILSYSTIICIYCIYEIVYKNGIKYTIVYRRNTTQETHITYYIILIVVPLASIILPTFMDLCVILLSFVLPGIYFRSFR